VYEEGDKAYLEQDYELAGKRYREALALLRPFFGRIDDVFRDTMNSARAAFADGNHADAVRLFDLAVHITPGDAEAQRWLERARNLESVLTLTDQGLRFEKQLELDAAKRAFEKALALDPAWEPATKALARVVQAIRQRSFEQRMTEGFNALAAGDYQSARAAFNAAKALKPDSPQPVDGLLQVDQEVRLADIRRMEQEAAALENNEEWQAAVEKYQQILEIDPLLQFAQEGVTRAGGRAALHRTLESYIAEPDSLSAPETMQAATQLLLDISRLSPMGPRLEDQKNQLSRLLKRAATPLTVRFVSDNATDVSIYRIGRLGIFSTQELQLRPGQYVAVGSRPGFRDVRLEFRVAPELEPEPVVVVCEEPI
jgi:tetratricopeptide (TPR) repeat protein